jgi:cation diffusion facilitator family transporter
MSRLRGLNEAMRSRTAESLRTVVVALASNLGTAVAKLLAALITGSSAMWAQTFHAFADSGNEVLLLIAQRRSGHAPDEQHPLGYGRAAYFWALVASMGVFAIGALLSVQQGIEGLVHRVPILSFRVAYLILFISFCLDGASLIQARRQLKKEARRLKRTFLEQLDLSSDPVVRAVFAEDAAALLGDLFALVGIALHHVTGSAIPDAIAAIMIGILLGIVAFHLAARNGDVLIGGQASAALCGKISAMIVAQPGIVEVTEILVTFIGPRRAWVVARVAIDETLTGANVEKLVRTAEDILRSQSPVIARVDLVPRGC